MLLEHLEVSGVRNLRDIKFDLCPGLNAFVGANGSGKTALLESVYMLGRGKSFRTGQIRSIINYDRQSLLVLGRFKDPGRGTVSLGVSRDAQNQPEFSINGKHTRKISELAKLLPVQLLLPDAARLIFGSPGDRRSFLDWGVFHVKPQYLGQWRRYQQVLKQRNGLLRQIARDSREKRSQHVNEQLKIWTEDLARLGESVGKVRLEYLDRFQGVVEELFKALGTPEGLCLGYSPGWKGDSLLNSLMNDLDQDLRRGNTRSGPHRADLALALGGNDAGLVLSRGQAKTVAHGFYLARAQLLEQIAGKKSLFLIDDVGAELDERHGEVFFELLCALEFQVLATSTHMPGVGKAFPGNGQKMFHVKHGSVS